MIACEEAVRRLWEYLDGTVEGHDRAALDEHLSRCRRCCAELEFAERMQGLLASSAADDVPEDVMTRLNATLEEVSEK